MSSKRKRLWGGIVIVLGLALTITYFVALPALVHWKLTEALRDAGLTDATFEVGRVGLSRSRISNFRSSDDASLQSLVVEYSLRGLARGRITEVRVEGLELTLDAKGGRLDLGVIDDVLARRAPAASQSATRASPQQATLPFDRIAVADSVIVVKTPQQEVRLPLAGTLAVQSNGQLVLNADVAGAAAPIRLAGTIDPGPGWVDLRATCDAVDVPGILSILQGLFPAVRARVTGTAAADVRYVTGEEGARLSARFEPRDLVARIPHGQEKISKLGVEKGVLSVEASWKPGALPGVTIMGSELSVVSESNDARLDGLAFSLVYGPGMESVTQSLSVRSATVGRMRVDDGATTFKVTKVDGSSVDGSKVDAKNGMLIEQTQWSWMGGTLSADRVTIEPGRPIDVTVVARSIQLKPLLDQFGSGKVSGDGRIDLTLPLRIDWPRIGFGRGSASNSGAGRLQIADARAFADSIAGAGGKKSAEQEQLKQEVMEALGDFDYRLLNVALRPSGDSLFADVNLAGNGRTGAKKALNLELHLSNVDDLVEFYLGVAGKLSGQ